MGIRAWLKWRKQTGQPAFLDRLRYVVLDTEFTSLARRANRLLSIGAIAMEGTRIRLGEQFYRTVNPGVAITAESVLIHRLRPTDVAQAEPPERVLAELQEFIGRPDAGTGSLPAVLVGHFLEIDLKLLRKEFGSVSALDLPAIDTMRVHQWLVRHKANPDALVHQFENVDLASLAQFYNLQAGERHQALQDAFITAQLWQKLLHEVTAMNLRTLGALLRIAGV